MKETYWDQLPKKGIITEHSTIIGSKEPKEKIIVPKPQTVPTIGPYEPWPEAPEGYKWTNIGIEKRVIEPRSIHYFNITSFRPFQARFLFLVGNLRDLFVEHMVIDNCYQSCSIKDIPASMFRRASPWTLDTINPHQFISLSIKSDSLVAKGIAGNLIGLTPYDRYPTR